MDVAQAQNIAHDIQQGMESDGDQFLTFMLAGEEYGVDILRVQEIKGWDSVTPIPNTPDYIRGVINLRGTIVPIIDLRRRFGLEAVEYSPVTVVIVLRVEDPETGNSRVMGLVVDAVSDVYNVPEDAIKPAPDFGSIVDVDFVKGLAALDEVMVIVLDVDRLLNANELATVSRAAQ
ncbi:MAG TPA: chemotaxis protein CheW [Gammaproteobacteria bacterium]|nr:chemotaxis protein CheW [Gammaproteobacteria bacterium]